MQFFSLKLCRHNFKLSESVPEKEWFVVNIVINKLTTRIYI